MCSSRYPAIACLYLQQRKVYLCIGLSILYHRSIYLSIGVRIYIVYR